MSKFGAVLLACAVQAAAVAADTDDFAGCKPGITFSGLGKGLDGNYMLRAYGYTGPGDRDQLCFGTDNQCEINLGGSAEDKLLAKGKWAITSGTYSDVRHLMAVCEEGCPDHGHETWRDLWPASWNQPMKWKIMNSTEHEGAVSVGAHCCKRKPQLCDTCATEMCRELIGPPSWFFFPKWNSCPPMLGSAEHPQSEFQKSCCSTISMPDGPHFPDCGCISTADVCDDSLGDVSVVV